MIGVREALWQVLGMNDMDAFLDATLFINQLTCSKSPHPSFYDPTICFSWNPKLIPL